MKTKLKRKKPRRLSLVYYIAYPGETPESSPFKRKQILLFLGEIPNMLGHCSVVDLKSGRVFTGYHTERFEEVPEDQT